MKVFWAWQSDTPGWIGRYFVRDALAAAIEQLRGQTKAEMDEPTSGERREEIHLDHDTRGVGGSPSIANVIFNKIDEANIFVADVTAVAETPGYFKRDGNPVPSKKVMNPNVSIELGYALKAHTDSSLLMVMNTHYGTRDDLPFDLKHKRGPIEYSLPPEATSEEITAALPALTGQLLEAISLIVTNAAEEAPQEVTYDKQPVGFCSATYFDNEEILYRDEGVPGEDTPVEFRFKNQEFMYLRVIPSSQGQRLRESTLYEGLSQFGLSPLTDRVIASRVARNDRGPLVFSSAVQADRLLAITQLFITGELWGINVNLTSPQRRQSYPRFADILPTVAIENAFHKTLSRYMKFEIEKLELSPPFIVEGGLVGVVGQRLALSNHNATEPIHRSELVVRQEIYDTDSKTLDAFLLELFEEFFDGAGERRPDSLNGFPRPDEGR